MKPKYKDTEATTLQQGMLQFDSSRLMYAALKFVARLCSTEYQLTELFLAARTSPLQFFFVHDSSLRTSTYAPKMYGSQVTQVIFECRRPPPEETYQNLVCTCILLQRPALTTCLAAESHIECQQSVLHEDALGHIQFRYLLADSPGEAVFRKYTTARFRQIEAYHKRGNGLRSLTI